MSIPDLPDISKTGIYENYKDAIEDIYKILNFQSDVIRQLAENAIKLADGYNKELSVMKTQICHLEKYIEILKRQGEIL
jgi:hypothetical protein